MIPPAPTPALTHTTTMHHLFRNRREEEEEEERERGIPVLCKAESSWPTDVCCMDPCFENMAGMSCICVCCSSKTCSRMRRVAYWACLSECHLKLHRCMCLTRSVRFDNNADMMTCSSSATSSCRRVGRPGSCSETRKSVRVSSPLLLFPSETYTDSQPHGSGAHRRAEPVRPVSVRQYTQTHKQREREKSQRERDRWSVDGAHLT